MAFGHEVDDGGRDVDAELSFVAPRRKFDRNDLERWLVSSTTRQAREYTIRQRTLSPEPRCRMSGLSLDLRPSALKGFVQAQINISIYIYYFVCPTGFPIIHPSKVNHLSQLAILLSEKVTGCDLRISRVPFSQSRTPCTIRTVRSDADISVAYSFRFY